MLFNSINIDILIENAPSNGFKPWLKFGKSESEWIEMIEECIQYLRTSKDLG